jgi:hypothetical protein
MVDFCEKGNESPGFIKAGFSSTAKYQPEFQGRPCTMK